MTVTIDKFGRVLIPKPLRDRLGLQPGAALSLDVRDGGDGAPSLELRPELAAGALDEQDGLLVYTGRLDPDVDLVAFIRDQREARLRHLAGLGPEAR